MSVQVVSLFLERPMNDLNERAERCRAVDQQGVDGNLFDEESRNRIVVEYSRPCRQPPVRIQ